MTTETVAARLYRAYFDEEIASGNFRELRKMLDEGKVERVDEILSGWGL